MKKHLKLSWLEIQSNGRITYKQKFNDGLNVLAGVNGTGKSTIIDFLAYLLGYEEIEWKEIQKKCDFVVGCFTIDGKPFLLKRPINELRQNPIQYKDIGEGSLWLTLPYKNSADRKSFSTILFDFLGYPSAKLENSSSLTMFQLLRLIYADQNTPTDSLFNRQKEFDNKGIRKSIAEFLLGIDDLESHELRQKIIDIDKQYANQSAEVKAITTFLNEWDLKSPNEIQLKIKEISTEVESGITSLKNIDSEATPDVAQRNLYAQIVNFQDEINSLLKEQHRIQTEISDSHELISLLEKSTSEIDESIQFYSIFSGLEYIYCPQCLLPIKESDTVNHCSLCHGSHADESKVNRFYLERKVELDFQLKESRKLIEHKNTALLANDKRIQQLKAEIKDLENHRELQSKLTNENVRIVSDLAIKIGQSNEKIKQLSSYLERANHLDEMNVKLQKLKAASSEYRTRVEQLNDQRVQYRAKIANSINELITRLLKADGGYETSFMNPKDAQLLFEDSKMSVDGAMKFSASSEAVLKLISRFSVFMLSLIYPQVRIPNFAIIDCMEDKGMLPERAEMTQNAILDELDKYSPESYQLIIATSMPSKRLLESNFILGGFLQKGQHTIDIKLDSKSIDAQKG